ncbi:MAG: YbbR-like domain-containing protein [Bacteroidota bacterium]
MKKRRLFLIFFSLTCSFLLWIAINLNNQFQVSINIPIRVQNLASDQAIASPLPKNLIVAIKGPGWQIINTTFFHSPRFIIDFNDLHKRGMIYTSKELMDHSNLGRSVTILASYPEKIELRLEERISRNIPIKPIVDVAFRDGFGIVGSIRIKPESVTVTGARSLINNFHEWHTNKITLRDLNMSISIVGNLEDTLNFELSRSITSAAIYFDVQPIAERTISDIPIEIVQVPDNKQVVLIPPKTAIIIRSGVNNIANLSSKDFHAFIDYRTILLDTSGMVQPSILGPENVKIVQQRPDRIQYVVRK